MILYDPVNKCCYDSCYNKGIPEDSIEISREMHQEIISALNTEGKDVEVVNGIPTVIDVEVVPDPSISVWANFEAEASAPATTTEPEGTWKGGEASALAIRGAALLAEDNGLTTAVITDVNREEHELTIAEVKKVSSAILFQWQAAFFKRQAALMDLEA